MRQTIHTLVINRGGGHVTGTKPYVAVPTKCSGPDAPFPAPGHLLGARTDMYKRDLLMPGSASGPLVCSVASCRHEAHWSQKHMSAPPFRLVDQFPALAPFLDPA